MIRRCLPCRHTAIDCSYPGEAKPACLLKRRYARRVEREYKGLRAKNRAISTREVRSGLQALLLALVPILASRLAAN